MSDKQKSVDKGKDQTTAEIVEGIHKVEDFFNKNKNFILYGIGGLALIVIIYFGYTEFIEKPKNIEALEYMYVPQNNFEKDSFRLALKGSGALEPGFESIANDYSSTPSGRLANFYAGVCCLKLGEYNEAIDYFTKFKSDDEILAPRALANIGNCYVELGEPENAVKYFERAARKKDNSLTPSYLMKATIVYEKLQKYDLALALYEEIKYKYPQSSEARTIDKYIERAKTLASK
jgi:tetratricopeptide (TPR) repeat protein